jgi:hypothetical protein
VPGVVALDSPHPPRGLEALRTASHLVRPLRTSQHCHSGAHAKTWRRKPHLLRSNRVVGTPSSLGAGPMTRRPFTILGGQATIRYQSPNNSPHASPNNSPRSAAALAEEVSLGRPIWSMATCQVWAGGAVHQPERSFLSHPDSMCGCVDDRSKLR